MCCFTTMWTILANVMRLPHQTHQPADPHNCASNIICDNAGAPQRGILGG